MARLFDDGASQYLEYDDAVLSAVPLVMAGWFNSDVLDNQTDVISIGRSDVSKHYFRLLLTTGPNLVARTAEGGPAQSATTSTTYSVDTWHHGCALFPAVDDRRIFLDRAGKGVNAVSRTPTGLNRTTIGALQFGGSVVDHMSGRIAEAAIWDLSVWPGATGPLKADEFERTALPALALGYSPEFFQLGLKAYWRLTRDEDQDRVGGYHMTAYNTPSIAPHPPMIYPAPAVFYSIPVAVGALQTIIPDAIASAEALGSSQLNLALLTSAITSAEALGSSQLNLALLASAITSAEAFGSQQLNLALIASAIASAEAHGVQQLNLALSAAAITSAEAHGTQQLNLAIDPAAIASAEAHGSAQLDLTIEPSAIAGQEAFGVTRFIGGVISAVVGRMLRFLVG